MKYVLLFTFLVLTHTSHGQELTGRALLEKAIAYHDPNDQWEMFNAQMQIEMETPKNSLRRTEVSINLPADYFKTIVIKDNDTIISELDKGKCSLALNGSTTIDQNMMDSLGISCDRTNMMKNYYTFLYGLPMKLKDPGTIVAEKVTRKTFKGKEYLVLKAEYDKDVGNDTWYFYFDPETFAMEVYQFFHDETKNDGEYILLSELVEVSGIKIPKVRAWYYNKDDRYLGTDTLQEATAGF